MTTAEYKSDSNRPASDGPRRRILYVEDDFDIWRVAQLKLKSKYDLVHAPTDRDACQQLTDQRDGFHAVLMDIDLRGSTLDGLQLLKLMRGVLDPRDMPDYARSVPVTQTPVIVLSASVGAYKEQDLVDLGASRALSKPIDFVDLTLTLTQLNLQQARRSFRPPPA